MDYTPPPFFERGPAPLTRGTFFALLSLALIATDGRFHYLDDVRRIVAVALYPLQVVATAPAAVATGVSNYFRSQARLEAENAALRQERLARSLDLQELSALRSENQRLRALLEAHGRTDMSSRAVELLYARPDPFARRIIVDKGAERGLRAGQPVVDEAGVVGQITRVHPMVSEVTLVTDKGQAVPVEVRRNGLRAVAYGLGQGDMLELRFIPVNGDLRDGDELITSGIDGVYPRGLNVATVVRIERDTASPFARILLKPAAGIDRSRHLLVLSEPPPRPAAPPAEEPGPAPLRKSKKKER